MRRRTIRRKRGGAIIGEGITGQVHRPPLQCSDGSHPTGDYVSKVARSKEKADEELRFTANIRNLHLEHVIVPEHMCIGDGGKYLLFMKYGGHDLESFFEYIEKHAYKNDMLERARKRNNVQQINELESLGQFDDAFYKNVIYQLGEIKKDVIVLNSNGIYHNDIHFGNVLYNEETKKAYLIDFDRSSTKPRNRQTDVETIDEMIEQLEEMRSMIGGRKRHTKKAGRSRRV